MGQPGIRPGNPGRRAPARPGDRPGDKATTSGPTARRQGDGPQPDGKAAAGDPAAARRPGQVARWRSSQLSSAAKAGVIAASEPVSVIERASSSTVIR